MLTEMLEISCDKNYSLSITSSISCFIVVLVLLYMSFFSFQIKNKETGACLDSMGRKSGEKVGLVHCHGMGGNQVCTSNNQSSSVKAKRKISLCICLHVYQFI